MPAAIDPADVLQAASIRVGDCLIWQRAKTRDGYGSMHNRQFPGATLAHRIAYLLAHGTIPAGTEIDHVCRNRACVNPLHLEAVPHHVNVRRGVRVRANHRNAKKTHCIRGHELAGENLCVEVWRGIVMRKCITCRRLHQRRRALTTGILAGAR